MEYLRYWSLRHPPFAVAPSFFYASTERRMVLAGVESLVTRRIPFGVIAGPSGCGTTTLLKFLATSSGFGDSAAEVIVSSGRLFRRVRPITALATLLGLPRSDSSEAMVADTLQAAAHQGVHTVWLIDDCSAADAASLPRIANAQQRLTIIVAGPKELTTTLNAGRPMVFNPLRLQETRRVHPAVVSHRGPVDQSL